MSGMPQARTPNRWGEGAQLRDDILKAAARILAESGKEEALSLRGVAREAQISAPSIYLHFKDKNELISAVMEAAFGSLADQIRGALAEAPAGEPLAAARAVARTYSRCALENPRRYRLMFGIQRIELSEEVAADHPIRGLLAVWVDAVAGCRRRGPERGPQSDERTAHLLWAGVHGIVSLWTGVPAPPNLDSIDALTDDLVDSLLTA